MTTILSILLTAFAYALPNGQSRYQVTLLYDGYLPVLGGMEQKAKVEIGLLVESKQAGEVTTALESFSVALRNLETGEWAALPFTANNVKEFFPASTIKHEPNGRILSTDMPRNDLPFRMPGLDLQHIPDVTFMLIEFPSYELRIGDEWRWTRSFGESLVRYWAKYQGRDDLGHRFDIRIEQEYETREDENNNPTKVESEVAQVVKTKVEATGKAWFSGPSGWISSAEVTATAVSDVYFKNAGEPAGLRRLQTQFKIEYKGQENEDSETYIDVCRSGTHVGRICPGRHNPPTSTRRGRHG